MSRTRCRRPLAIAFAFASVLAAPLVVASAFADEPTPTTSLPTPRATLPPRSRGASGRSESGGTWWLGSAGIAGALAVVGGLSLASRRFLPSRETGPMRVVGRSSLSSKHAVYLLRVGDRVLIVGTGPQGAPSTLGEVTDPAELARLIPARGAGGRGPSPLGARSAPTRPSTGLDLRIGDDE